jgi:hypothetical protein
MAAAANAKDLEGACLHYWFSGLGLNLPCTSASTSKLYCYNATFSALYILMRVLNSILQFSVCVHNRDNFFSFLMFCSLLSDASFFPCRRME